MLRKQTILLFFLVLWTFVKAQAPDIIPYGEPEPLEFTLTNIIVFIVIPVLIIIAYIFYRKNRKKQQRKKHEK